MYADQVKAGTAVRHFDLNLQLFPAGVYVCATQGCVLNGTDRYNSH